MFIDWFIFILLIIVTNSGSVWILFIYVQDGVGYFLNERGFSGESSL